MIQTEKLLSVDRIANITVLVTVLEDALLSYSCDFLLEREVKRIKRICMYLIKKDPLRIRGHVVITIIPKNVLNFF
jgi:hypothetical protein